jgi:Ser/Thr protein kinase RdoA (MazF antagonist)
VLRRLPAPALSAASLVEDVAWLHGFLGRLAGLSFPSPRPLPCFDGQSWTVTDGTLWEIASFLPGHAVCWAAVPPMEEIGGLLGRYHTTARQIEVTSQRPGAIPLADVPAVLMSHSLAVVPSGRQAIIRQLAAQLARDLHDAGRLTRERLVVHGDFTNDNVIADGMPPRALGVIDFANAHADTPLADLGYGLWRSGRPHEQADRLDFSRARQFLRGYASIVRVSPDQASLIPVYLRGRGLQMIAKRVRAGRNETGMLAQLQWLTVNSDAVADVFAAALP